MTDAGLRPVRDDDSRRLDSGPPASVFRPCPACGRRCLVLASGDGPRACPHEGCGWGLESLRSLVLPIGHGTDYTVLRLSTPGTAPGVLLALGLHPVEQVD